MMATLVTGTGPDLSTSDHEMTNITTAMDTTGGHADDSSSTTHGASPSSTPPHQECTSTTPDLLNLPPQVMLPPCAVCGAPSSGYHYGANTCEACKGFYRRCLIKDLKLKCRFQGICQIGSKTMRSRCPYCRFQKCLSVGMSKEGVKIGRHTHERKTNSIQEVKRLEIQNRMTCEGALSDAIKRDNELNNIIKRVTNIRVMGEPRSTEEYEAHCKAEQIYLEKRNLENMIFGSRKPLSREEHSTIYNATGLDIDGRKKKMLSMMTPAIPKVQAFQKFTATLPGFSELPPKDQQLLIQASAFERWVYISSAWHNADEELLCCPLNCLMIFSLDEMMKMMDDKEENLRKVLKIIKRYQKLELTGEENVLVGALALMNADTHGISTVGSNIVSASTDYLVEALEHLINKNHDPEDRTFSKVIDIMTALRPLNDVNANFTKILKEDYPGKLDSDVVAQHTMCLTVR